MENSRLKKKRSYWRGGGGEGELTFGDGGRLFGELYPVGENEQIFSWWGDFPHLPVGKTLVRI